jgi:O-antigen ligase
MKSGRLEIPDSLFFENANDLGLALLLAICQTAYLFFIPGIASKVWGGLVAISSLYFMFKTGSRGCFLALLLVGCVAFFLSRQKVLFAGLGVLGLVVVLIATPNELRRRLTFIVSDPTTTSITTDAEIASYGSQLERQRMLLQSVMMSLQHPVFGVGPGEFAVAVFEDAKKEGKRANWLGTHNTYTQVSSECGLPALGLYLGIILWTLKTARSIYRSSASRPGMHAVAGLSYSLFLGTIAFAVATFFFHDAYTGFLPILSGSVFALRSAVQRETARALPVAA